MNFSINHSETPTWYDIRRPDGTLAAILHHPGPRHWWLHRFPGGERSLHKSQRAAIESLEGSP